MVFMYTDETNNIKIEVEPKFLEDESDPSSDCYIWAYQVSISNNRDDSIRLLSRHWTIADKKGMVQEVDGQGVLGEQPWLEPGDTYSYISGAPLSSPSGIMVGSYTFKNSSNEIIEAKIPAFSLDSPHDYYVLN